MTNTNETIADIIADMRALSNSISDGIIAINGRIVADRLEAAWKREKATTEKFSAVGNGAKLREALEVLLNVVCSWDDHLPPVVREGEYREAYRKAEAALAVPLRNCDIGTVDEQTERFVDFTSLYFQSEMVRLAMNWAQMPYEEGGAK